MIIDTQAFEQHVPELRRILARRKSSWTLTTLDWEDAESILLTHLWQKFHMYVPEKGPLENWANALISNQIKNLWRDHLYKWSRPCVASGASGGTCVFNQGNERCGFTESGIQCAECPLFARWQRKKEAQYNIKASLPLDYHAQEVQNIQEDFFDIDAAKIIVDEKMLEQLDKHEARIYVLLFIKHKSIEEVGKIMKYKKQGAKIAGYQVLKKLCTKFKQMAREIIEKQDF